MPKLNRNNCTLHPDGKGVYHFQPKGSETLTATIKNFPNNRFLQQWGVRAYQQPKQLWTWRPTFEEAVAVALTEHSGDDGCST